MAVNEEKSPTLEDILKDAYDHVVPADKSKLERAKNIVSKLVSTSEDSSSILINEMKESDDMFKLLFEGVFFAGLFCDGLRDVNKSNEFKLYFVLNLPFDNELNLSDCHSNVSEILDITAGYFCLWSEKPSPNLLPQYSDCREIYSFFDYRSTGYFFWRTYYYVMVSSRVLHWFGNLVSVAVGNISTKRNSMLSRWFYKQENLFYDIGIEELSPANLQTYYKYSSDLEFYLKVRNEEGFSVNIQMQPVFNYKGKFLVPKPLPDNATIWRLSNIKAEKKILHGGECVEQVIRYLIKLCCMQGTAWEELTSYHIKTVVMLHLRNNPWLTKDLGLLFMGSLRDLLECLAHRKIAYYFNDKCNLLSDVDVHIIETIKGRLQRMLNDIHKNPTITLMKYFTVNECNTETIDGSDRWYCSIM